MTALLAKTDDQLDQLALQASIDIDAAIRYQGRKYDLGDGSVSGTVGVPQAREFPRIVDSDGGAFGPGLAARGTWPSGSVQDWDPAANDGAGGPVAPYTVKVACVYQMDWLRTPANAERLAAIRSGLASQSTGSMSESFRSPAELAAMGGAVTLAPRAFQLMDRNYRLRTGRIL